MPTPLSRRTLLATLAASPLLARAAQAPEYRRAVGPRDWAFPRDHGRHDGFKTEWWYLTGHLRTDEAKRHFGYQLTFFRSALTPTPQPRPSPWAATHLFLAHAAISDVTNQTFRHAERLARERQGYAHASAETMDVRLKDWSTTPTADGQSIRLRAADTDKHFSLDLTTPLPLTPSSPPPPTSPRLIFQGPGGLNPKSAAPGNASYYYSLTRLPTTGAITLDATKHNVTGLSWMDREFSTSSLAPHQVGWDWIALHLRSGHDLMLYRIRNQANQTDYLSGTLVSPAGVPTYLTTADIALAPTATWTSPATKATYPSAWSIAVRGLPKFTIRTLIPDQELQTPNSTDVTYYEGAVSAKGDDGADLGEGYLEMTGYTKPITR